MVLSCHCHHQPLAPLPCPYLSPVPTSPSLFFLPFDTHMRDTHADTRQGTLHTPCLSPTMYIVGTGLTDTAASLPPPSTDPFFPYSPTLRKCLMMTQWSEIIPVSLLFQRVASFANHNRKPAAAFHPVCLCGRAALVTRVGCGAGHWQRSLAIIPRKMLSWCRPLLSHHVMSVNGRRRWGGVHGDAASWPAAEARATATSASGT